MQGGQKAQWDSAIVDSIAATMAGVPDDEASQEALLKARLAREIGAIIKGRRLTQVRAAALLDLRQPDVSAIVTGRTEKFSVGRLLRCLDRLDHRVHVDVRPKPPQERRLPTAP
ncbi:MAG: helix-turn-helix domain-containing protein [Rhizobiaceae bacterium]